MLYTFNTAAKMNEGSVRLTSVIGKITISIVRLEKKKDQD